MPLEDRMYPRGGEMATRAWATPYSDFQKRWYNPEWVPDEFPGQEEFYRNLSGDFGEESDVHPQEQQALQEQAWRDYSVGLMNAFLPYMGTRDVDQYARQLSDYSGAFRYYDDPLAGASETFLQQARRNTGDSLRDVDRAFADTGRNRWDAIIQGLNFANENLVGDTEGSGRDVAGDDYADDSDFRTANQWLRALASVGHRYGTAQEGREDLSRSQWRNLANEWGDAESRAQNLGVDESVINLGRTLLMPRRYTGVSPRQRELSGGATPTTDEFGSQWAYRNPRYT